MEIREEIRLYKMSIFSRRNNVWTIFKFQMKDAHFLKAQLVNVLHQRPEKFLRFANPRFLQVQSPVLLWQEGYQKNT